MSSQVVTLNYFVQGEGKPLLLLHGLFGMSSNLALIAKIMAQYFTVYSLDLRNHGQSPWSSDMSLQVMANDVLAFMVRQNLDQASFLGHSLGGKVAMQLAVSHPERVSQLVVADIAPVEYPPHHNDVLEALEQVDLTIIQSRREAGETLAHSIEEEGVRQFLLKSLYQQNEKFQWRFNLSAITSEYDALRQGVAGGVFNGPTLFIKGEQSGYIRADNQAQMQALFPNFQFKMIQNAGHWLHAEKPAAFNGIVERFLLSN